MSSSGTKWHSDRSAPKRPTSLRWLRPITAIEAPPFFCIGPLAFTFSRKQMRITAAKIVPYPTPSPPVFRYECDDIQPHLTSPPQGVPLKHVGFSCWTTALLQKCVHTHTHSHSLTHPVNPIPPYAGVIRRHTTRHACSFPFKNWLSGGGVILPKCLAGNHHRRCIFVSVCSQSGKT